MASQTHSARGSVVEPLQPQPPNTFIESACSPPEVSAFYKLKEQCQQAGFLDLPNNPGGNIHTGINDDVTLLRFLRARKFNVEGAYTQFKEAHELHQANNIIDEYDRIDVREYDEARRFYPHWTGRRDKRGLPICFFDISYLDADIVKSYESSTRQAACALTVHDSLTRFALPLCSMAASSVDTAAPISSCLFVADISTLGFKQAWNLRQYVQNVSKLLGTSYPEVIDQALLIGAPSYFPTIWSWVKGWVDPVTAAKLVFVSSSEASAKMSEFIEHENIPKRYGGNFDCSHGMLPVLDDALSAALTWPEGGVTQLPAGPLRWIQDRDGNHLLMAVGTENGSPRRKQIAVMKPT